MYISDISSLKDTISTWMLQCTETHESFTCAYQPASWLPPRLVDIGMRTSNQPSCLMITEALYAPDYPYLALSYVSSDDEFEGLLKSNLDDWLNLLALLNLPSLFHSACLTAEVLSYRYIWIDKLCVIQNSTEDQIEASQLRGRKFQNCAINITADSVGGFVRALDHECGNDRTSHLPKRGLVPENIWFAKMVCSPLSRDARYFRGHIFASRRVHFGKNQFF